MSGDRSIRLQFNIPLSPGSVPNAIHAALPPHSLTDVPVHTLNDIKTGDSILDNSLVNTGGKSSEMAEYLSTSSSLKVAPMGNNKESTLGTWFIDKKRKKRKYITLLGECLHGTKAVKQSKLDDATRKQSNKFTGKYELQSLNRHVRSEYLQQKDLSKLSSWGLPPSTCNKYESVMSVSSLFPWQIDCLRANNDDVYLNGKNLIFSAPTSGGKTLVSELLMLRRLATVKGNSLTHSLTHSLIHSLTHSLRYYTICCSFHIYC